MGQDHTITGNLTIRGNGNVIITRCNAPAPFAVNGGGYVGCSKDAKHEGPHEVKIEWK